MFLVCTRINKNKHISIVSVDDDWKSSDRIIWNRFVVQKIKNKTLPKYDEKKMRKAKEKDKVSQESNAAKDEHINKDNLMTQKLFSY